MKGWRWAMGDSGDVCPRFKSWTHPRQRKGQEKAAVVAGAAWKQQFALWGIHFTYVVYITWSEAVTQTNCVIETWIWIKVYARRYFIPALPVLNFICSCLYLLHYNTKIGSKYFSKTCVFWSSPFFPAWNTESCSFCHCRYLEFAQHFRSTCMGAKSHFWVS